MFFALPVCPFPGPLARDSRLFLGLFLSVPITVFELLAFLTPGLKYMRKNKNSGNSPLCHSLGPEFSGLPSSLHFSDLMFVLYIISRVLSVQSRSNREKYVFFTFSRTF